MRSIALVSIALAMALPATARGDRPSLRVATVEELYAAVNSPSSEGAEIVMAPGLYELSMLDPTGAVRPNLGRLELPPGAALRGQNHYHGDMEPIGLDDDGDLVFADPATESIIDAGGLPASAFVIPLPNEQAGTGVLRIGRANEVSRLTMRNNAVADGLINIDLVPAGVGGMNARVTRCILEDANESIVYRHFLANGTDRDSRALIERNVMRHLHGRFGMGIRIIANNRTHGSTLRLVLRRNRIYDAGYGLHAQAEGSSDHHFEIVSDGNLIEGTATGMGLEGEFSRAGVTGNNHVTWLSRNDAIVDNNRDVASLAQFQIPGGVVIRGGIVAAGVTASVNDSSVRIHLEGTHFARGNTQLDLAAYGAWSSGGSVGKRNRVDVVVCDATTEDPTGSFLAVDAVPPDPPSTAAADRNVASIGAANVTFVDGTNAVLAGIPLEPPLAIHCPADVTWVTSDPGGAVVPYPPPIVDSCGGADVTYAPATGTFLAPGTTTVTASSGAVSCRFNVTVVVE
ncbi:MAG TPA: hypothetical protein VMS14_05675 [Ilumatobacteraceae bacterium]|nr:hypothetical protein [Ilumatobacteraceae bacterium]